MKTLIGYSVLIGLVLAICGMAMRATHRDNHCDGRIEGMVEMRCVPENR